MRLVRVVNRRHGGTLGTRIGLADRWWPRLRGLSGRTPEPGEGLILRPCRAVHMFGMRCALDIAFLDRSGLVVATYAALPPGARSRWHSTARDALELPAGTLALTDTREGDTLEIA